MTRLEFTRKIVTLLHDMILMGEQPLIDYVKRSREEQKRLYDKGLSKCDGTLNESAHQYGKAMDIYFPNENGELIAPKLGFEYWHERWEKVSGKPMIDWDKSHFES